MQQSLIPVTFSLWLLIPGLVLFIVSFFLPKGFGTEEDIPWFKEMWTLIRDCVKIILDESEPPRKKVRAGGLLLIMLGIVVFLLSIVLGLFGDSGGDPKPTPSPTSTATPSP
ncbi:hypothetical protein HAV21_03315 [Paenarthrobacter sp. MSM-2-10-13]|uniref:hypothetical protein n=1 Tax=Paenarthrobacter sp. MSM-2-10-13 TaxID=2717318 RepID=UPI00141DA020|nr:hypothetical protein [Paenarthrobacter sp. MSM-2-10-13]NHW45927.1 hypothetical protein [Paenarthrobacter sp. MSM-2-10-13]